MKTTVFRKVSVKERLPGNEGQYLTSSGLLSYSLIFDWINDNNYTCKSPEWFLEEIELPSEEEVVNACECNSKSESNDFIVGVECGAIDAYNYILNKLK